MIRNLTIAFLTFLAFSQAVAQMHISHLQFNTEIEKALFTAIDQNKPYNPLALFLVLDTTSSLEKFQNFENQLNKALTSKILEKSPKAIYNLSHKKFFKKYMAYSQFSEILQNGSYNCLTASALTAYMYLEKGYSVEIRELAHHVYLEVKHKNKSFLVETTDPVHGFKKLNTKLSNSYRKDSSDNSWLFKYMGLYNFAPKEGFFINNAISLKELAGLHYYNESVLEISQEDFFSAVISLEKAYYLYPSERILAVLNYALIQVAKDKTQPLLVRSSTVSKLAMVRDFMFLESQKTNAKP